MTELLSIVNDQDEVIGSETRENIQRAGLLHRAVNIYFVTPDREIIFQHRAKDKRIHPDLLDATAGGGVAFGDSYEATASKETLEETGLKISSDEFILLKKSKEYAEDVSTGRISHSFNARYLYVYREKVEDLKVETGKALGFEVWPLDKLASLAPAEKNIFVPEVLEFVQKDLLRVIKDWQF